MIVHDLDLGVHPLWKLPMQTWKGPESGHSGSSVHMVKVAGGKEAVYSFTVMQIVRTETVYVTVPVQGTDAATQALLSSIIYQLVELSSNLHLQPTYVQWKSGGGIVTPDPQDGWYYLESVKPDMEFIWSNAIPVTIQFRKAHAGTIQVKTLAMWTAGAALSTTSTGIPTNWVAIPINATIPNDPPFVRYGSEGPMQLITTPLPAHPFTQSSVVADWHLGGCRVFDVMAPITTNPVPVTPLHEDFEIAGQTAQTVHNDPFNNLNALTNFGSAPTVSSNVVTLASGAGADFGHLNWQDATYTLRFKWVTGSNLWAKWHSSPRSATGASANYIYASLDGATINLNKNIGGVSTTALGNTAAVLTTGTFYWVRIVGAGTSYTATVFNDSAGAIGTQIASTGAQTITDTILQTGCAGFYNNGGTGGLLVGGAFSNVCMVSQVVTSGWTFNAGGTTSSDTVMSGCYDAVHPFSGSRCVSIYVNSTTQVNPSANWASPLFPVLGSVSYTGTVQAQGPTTAVSGSAFYIPTGADNWNGNFSFTAGVYTLQTLVFTPTVNSNGQFYVRPAPNAPPATGTYYFDNAMVYRTSTPANFSGGTHTSWVEVKDADHVFIGDIVITNSLLMFTLSPGQIPGVVAYGFASATAQGWLNCGQIHYQDNSLTSGALAHVKFIQIGLEELRVTLTSNGPTDAAEQWIRMQRGALHAYIDFRPLTQGQTANKAIVVYQTATGSPKIVYNSGSIRDVPVESLGLTATSDFNYAGTFLNSLTSPFIVGLLWQNPPTLQPAIDAAGGFANGDNSLPQNTFTTYGFFVLPFANTRYLQAEAESGTLSGGAVSQANAAASNGNEVKIPTGTGAQLPSPNPLQSLTDGGAAAGTLTKGGYTLTQTWTDATGETLPSANGTTYYTITNRSIGTLLEASNVATFAPTITSTTAGTCLVAVLGNGNGQTFSAPAGWIFGQGQAAVGTTTAKVEIWYYPNNPGGITSATFTVPSSLGTILRGELSEWNNVALVSVPDGSPQSDSQFSGTTTNPTITGLGMQVGDVEIAAWTQNLASASTVTFTTPSGWTRLAANSATNSTVHLDAEYMINNSSTLPSGTTLTSSVTTQAAAAVLIALKPAPSNTVFLTTNGDKINVPLIAAPTGATNGKFYFWAGQVPTGINAGLAATQAVSAGNVAAFSITANPGNTTQPPSGNTTGGSAATDLFGTAWIPSPGSYSLWCRVKVTSASGSNPELYVGLWDATTGSYWSAATITANQILTSYSWFRVAQVVTPPAGHLVQFRLHNYAATTTDWFIDEAVLVPLFSITSYSFPQDIWQQMMFQRTASQILKT